MGSSLYKVAVTVKSVPAARWKTIRKACAGRIGSLVELLRGVDTDDLLDEAAARGNSAKEMSAYRYDRSRDGLPCQPYGCEFCG